MPRGRGTQGSTGLVGVAALLALALQLALVINGSAVLVEHAAAPSAPVRLGRFFAYFTIKSNILVLLAAAATVLRPREAVGDGGSCRWMPRSGSR